MDYNFYLFSCLFKAANSEVDEMEHDLQFAELQVQYELFESSMYYLEDVSLYICIQNYLANFDKVSYIQDVASERAGKKLYEFRKLGVFVENIVENKGHSMQYYTKDGQKLYDKYYKEEFEFLQEFLKVYNEL